MGGGQWVVCAGQWDWRQLSLSLSTLSTLSTLSLWQRCKQHKILSGHPVVASVHGMPTGHFFLRDRSSPSAEAQSRMTLRSRHSCAQQLSPSNCTVTTQYSLVRHTLQLRTQYTFRTSTVPNPTIWLNFCASCLVSRDAVRKRNLNCATNLRTNPSWQHHSAVRYSTARCTTQRPATDNHTHTHTHDHREISLHNQSSRKSFAREE